MHSRWGLGFPKIKCTVPFWGSHNKDYHILGSTLGFPCSHRKYHIGTYYSFNNRESKWKMKRKLCLCGFLGFLNKQGLYKVALEKHTRKSKMKWTLGFTGFFEGRYEEGFRNPNAYDKDTARSA